MIRRSFVSVYKWSARPRVTIVLALCVLSTRARADVSALGSEFQVNVFTSGSQTEPSVAAQSNGDFAVVWLSDGQDGDSGGIFARGFNSIGVPVGGDVQINLTSAGVQGSPAICAATLDDGINGPVPTFQSVWASTQGSGLDVWGLEGGFVPAEFEVNTYTTGNQTIPHITGLAGGGFVVAWYDADRFPPLQRIFARSYDATSTPLAPQYQIGSIANPGNRSGLGLASTPSGGFVASFSDDYGASITIIVHDGTGSVVNGSFVASGTGSSATDAAVDAAGEPFVVWDNGASDDIFGVRTNSFGSGLGSVFQLNTYTTGAQSAPHVAANADGTFLVVWISPHDGDGTGIFGRLYDASSAPVGTEFQINSTTTGDLDYPGVAALPGGNFVVTWHDYDQDDVFARFVGDLCPPTPTAGCRTASKSVLLIKDNSDDTKDKLLWKWIDGATTSAAEFDDPTTTRRYALCVYDGNGRVLSAEVPPDATKWKNLQYKDVNAVSHGIRKVTLKPGAADDAKILVKGKGGNLPDPPLGSLVAPVIAQVVNNETTLCFEHAFDTTEIVKNDAALFKAKAH